MPRLLPSEPFKIVYRRFVQRVLESGLLVMAVALGVGAAAAGFSLVSYTRDYNSEVLASPAYREILVSTRGESEDMETPVAEKALNESTVLTHADLEVRSILPAVAYAYIADRSRMRFPDEQFLSGEGFTGFPGPPGGGVPEASAADNAAGSGDTAGQEAREGINGETQEAGGDPEARFAEMREQLLKAREDSSVIFPEVDELAGWEVTADFFQAWDIQARWGSLFTEDDMISRNSVMVLGAETARILVGDGDPGTLVGRKVSSFEGLTTIIGVLSPLGNDYDDQYFTPARDLAAAAGSQGGVRFGGMNRQLRFTVTDPADLGPVSLLLQDWFEDQYGSGQVVVTNPRAEAEQLMDRNSGISYLILFLSLAGLFIASVNVSHILLGRALRMRRNIGILKALGSSRRGIVELFTAEAVMITLGGALLGTLLALPLSRVMTEALEIGSGSILYLILGILLSWILTFAFSVVPALQGAKIEAAEAMRRV